MRFINAGISSIVIHVVFSVVKHTTQSSTVNFTDLDGCVLHLVSTSDTTGRAGKDTRGTVTSAAICRHSAHLETSGPDAVSPRVRQGSLQVDVSTCSTARKILSSAFHRHRACRTDNRIRKLFLYDIQPYSNSSVCPFEA